MKQETKTNLIWLALCALGGLSSLVCALFGAWWHLLTAALCFILAHIFYTDSQYGVESVKHYFSKERRK